jgi:ligand-binding SRPBCC domain-containing protein
MDSKFTKESFYSVPKEKVFAFHEQPDAFRLLTPPSSNVEVLSTASTLRPSTDIVRFISKFLFLKFKFEMVHTEYEEGVRFVDEQRKGLFSSWRHEHQFKSGGWEEDPASLLRDQIVFSHPLLPLFKPFVTHRLKGLFQ